MPVAHGPFISSILQAIAQNQPVVLPPETFFTDPKSKFEIPVPATGVRIQAAPGPLIPRPVIKRPDDALDGDDQCGLAFVPDKPTQPEIDAAQWKRFSDGDTGVEFEYDILIRGTVLMQDVDIDCNMLKQNLSAQPPKNPWEHSAMLKFSGARHFVGTSQGLQRFIYVAFQSVILRGMNTKKGGNADDILIGRGGFHPNIAHLVLEGVHAGKRVVPHRDSLGLSELAARVDISNSSFVSLHLEDDVRWDRLPRQTPEFQKAVMNLSQIQTDRLDLGAKGFVLNVLGQGLTVTEAFTANQVTGSMSNSTIHKGDDPRLFRLDMQFMGVHWTFDVVTNANPPLRGLSPQPLFGEPCRAVFRNNTFTVVGPLPAATTGQIISGDVSLPNPNVSGEEVTLAFEGCTFDARMGTAAFPNTRIAHPGTRGVWVFRQADLNGLTVEQAFRLPLNSGVPDPKLLKEVVLQVL